MMGCLDRQSPPKHPQVHTQSVTSKKLRTAIPWRLLAIVIAGPRSSGVCLISSRRGLPRRRRARNTGRDSIAVGGAGGADAGYVHYEPQKQPEPVYALNTASALQEPDV